MKKLLTSLCVVALALVCLLVLPTRVDAATEGDYTYTVSNGEATITDCNTYIAGNVTVPSTLGGCPVTKIGYKAFSECKYLVSVVVPVGVKVIDNCAFYFCSNLKSVIIPNSVISIGNLAFGDCRQLNDITLPDNVTTIGESAFYQCLELENITIPPKVTTISDGLFTGCNKLASVTLPDSVTTIGESAFNSCRSLENITIPNGVTNIGRWAFNYCPKLRNITIPDSVVDICEYAFNQCSALESVILPAKITTISDGLFAHCSSLKGITIPDSVNSIGESAFKFCENLGHITIPKGVTIIKENTFNSCNKLCYIVIAGEIRLIGEGAFEKCSGLHHVFFKGNQDQYNNVLIGQQNDYFAKARMHTNSLGEEIVIKDFCVQKVFYCRACDEYITNTKLAHSYTKKVTKPTCTAKGYTTYTCGCGATYKDNYTKALGHSYKSGRCTRCNHKPPGAKITTQPVNVAVSSGKTAKVTVKATGTGLKYTWYYAKKGSSKYTKVSGSSSSYSVKMSSSVDGRKVYCQITDSYGNVVKSSTVTLYKGTPAKITTQPKGITVANGKTGKLEIKASGSSLKYQWYVKYKGASSFTKVGKSSKTYSFTMASKFSDAQAYCVVKDKYGIEVKSSVVTIKLAAKPKIITQPKSMTQVSGKTVKFTVKASGESLKYQWYYAKKGSSGFKKLSGKTSATYSVKVSSSVNGRKYYCLVTDKYGQTVKTSQATLTMKTVAKITTQPKNVTVKNGKTAKVTIKAVGDGLKYTWYYLKPGATKYVKASATGASYSVKMAAAWKNAKVYCVIADKYGNTVKSKVVTLKMK